MTLIMTCKVGKFTFPDGTPLSLAKLVRDTVMGQMLNPKQRELPVHTEAEAYELIRRSESTTLRETVFGFELTEELSHANFRRALHKLATQARVTYQAMEDFAHAFDMATDPVVTAVRIFRKKNGYAV